MTEPVIKPVTESATDQTPFKAIPPCAGLLPLSIGALDLTEQPHAQMTLLIPWEGQETALSKALEKAHGVALPGVGQSTQSHATRALWFGHNQVLLTGPAPDPALADLAAVTDLSDAYACLRLEGAGADRVLARLTPLDLRDVSFRQGAVARTEIAHMAGALIREGEAAFGLMVYRSMAATLVHEVSDAMQSVTARAALGGE
ncbi:sarcosine oxidase subunit gamma [Rhodalgimonas zhirmunskyi]|uniref:Sarcosine oxidase subunit gamma n=1 Tax=Rhodalgimonas zhirmunskyi TaxID=2964767 RepID=A0AAJ1U8I8_9RHOB|nr:sarcosine oxidase subunit gamma [Rhodoalgimonas zhirmunskyi]MDQ2093258.1 sarcosine oxidase subunit gamma [Rhodoalgimonas zhirmunskyi]